MKTLFTLMFTVVFVFTVSAQTAEVPSGGLGRIPYSIEKWEHLLWLSQNPDKWGSNFIQTADITFPRDVVTWDRQKGMIPIGNTNTPFTGSYDGKGHKVTFVFIDRDVDCVGFFGKTDDALIKNLTVQGSVRGSMLAGMLCGSLNNSVVENCATLGSVECWGQRGEAGGFVGRNLKASRIENCFNRCDVEVVDYQEGIAGGFVAYNNNSNIAFSYSTGLVSDVWRHTGGFVGLAENSAGLFSRNFYDAAASGQNDNVGAMPKTSAEMQDQATYSGWDFTSVWQIDPTENDGYPYFAPLTTSLAAPEVGSGSKLYGVCAFPNPFKEVLNFQGDVVKVLVINALGQTVVSMELLGQKHLNTSNLGSGIYVLEATFSDGSVIKQKLLKQ